MKVYDKIKNMTPPELAQFISDLLCGNPNELVENFADYHCSDCNAGGLLADGEIHECDYQAGNCNDVSRVQKWLESEVEEDD